MILVRRTLLFCGGSILGCRILSVGYHQYNALCESNEETNTINDNIIPSFRSLLFYKMWNMEFRELNRPEVLIELLLLGCPIIVGTFGSYMIYTKAYKAWKHRQFYNTINVTLNTITRNQSIKGGPKHYNIYFRTLVEKELNQIIPNEEGVKLLIKAAKSTNTKEPFIKIEDERTYWTMCNYFANQISTLSSAAFLHRDILSHNDSVISQQYLMILSSEPPTSAMNYKIRVQLVKKSVIEQLIKDDEFYKENNGTDIEWRHKLNNIEFGYRWMVIGKIADIYKKQTQENDGKLLWGSPLCEIELSTPMFCKDYMEQIRNNKMDTDFDAIMQYDKGNVLSGWNKGCVCPPDYKPY